MDHIETIPNPYSSVQFSFRKGDSSLATDTSAFPTPVTIRYHVYVSNLFP